MNPFLKLLSKSSLFTGINSMEDNLVVRGDTLHATGESPVRFEIIQEGRKRGKGGPPKRLFPIMLPTLFGIRKTLLSLEANPRQGLGPLVGQLLGHVLKCAHGLAAQQRIPCHDLIKEALIEIMGR